MFKFNERHGSALMDYALSAALFGMVIGSTVFQLNPHLLKNYFIQSMGNTEQNGSQLKMKVLGE